jgi:hypothetical protein
MDGNVILWGISISADFLNIQLTQIKVYEIQELSSDQNPVPEEFYVQSISIGKKNILAGLKNGDVYELSLFTDEEATNAGF